MGYWEGMNVRPALPVPDETIIDVPITEADWAAMSAEERAFIQVGFDEIDRGEFVTDAEMQVFFEKLREKYASEWSSNVLPADAEPDGVVGYEMTEAGWQPMNAARETALIQAGVESIERDGGIAHGEVMAALRARYEATQASTTK